MKENLWCNYKHRQRKTYLNVGHRCFYKSVLKLALHAKSESPVYACACKNKWLSSLKSIYGINKIKKESCLEKGEHILIISVINEVWLLSYSLEIYSFLKVTYVPRNENKTKLRDILERHKITPSRK